MAKTIDKKKAALTRFQTIGIVMKRRSETTPVVAKRLALWLVKQNRRVYLQNINGLSHDAVLKNSGIHVCSRDVMVSRADCIVVLGGDGTLIRTAREVVYSGRSVPLIGVNMGTLGFLTKIKPNQVEKVLKDVFSGSYYEDIRTCLEVIVRKQGSSREQRFFVLNDVVVNKAGVARMISIKIAIDERYIATFRADGVIVATPTGSTAYSLAAGGPIVSPSVGGTVLTPICPQFFGHRSIVIPDHCVVELSMAERNPEKIYLSLDGQMGQEIAPDQRIEIRKAIHTVSLITSKSWDFFETLRQKLKWTVQHAQGVES